MASSLKNKLNRLKAASEPRKTPPVPELLEYTTRFPADERLFHLDGRTLRRLGLDGAFDPTRTLFFDTETTGLSGGTGTVAFLIGVGRVENGEFVVRQFLMPGYAAESALLEKVNRIAEGCDVAVTFNGKSFDVPLLASRCMMNRMKNPIGEMRQLDLIHPARRAWKLRLKDCSLANIEEKALGVRRENDLPGSEVPERYFTFLKTQDPRLLTDIVEHNRQDIVSLAMLLLKLYEVYDSPTEQTSMLDVFSLGRALDRQGERQEAGKCYRLAARPPSMTSMESLSEMRAVSAANRNLSVLLRREGDQAGAQKVWREMIRRGQMGVFPYVELAKALEHREGNLKEALLITRRAEALAQDDREKNQLKAREMRLLRKIDGRKETREE